MKVGGFRDLIKKLLHIDDTPERTALAFSVGVFLGFSPFLGFHTLGGLALAFVFRLNRVAVLLGAWMNTPWWIVPYYMMATWVGMKLVRCEIEWTTFLDLFHTGAQEGFVRTGFWHQIASQWSLLLSFGVGSLFLAFLLSLVTYPLSLRLIRFYRSKRMRESDKDNF